MVMSSTETVRAILREHPASRYDVTQAYLIYLGQFTIYAGRVIGEVATMQKVIGVATFLRTWQRHRRSAF